MSSSPSNIPPSNIPESYSHSTTEEKFITDWEERGVYKWDSTASRDNTFVVDTPPPTVSGSLHMGHVFSYTHTDVLVRYQRMIGKNIFYPMGWDDNGLATERRVQNYFNVRCDPRLPYDKDFKAEMAGKDAGPSTQISRKNFIEICAILTTQDEAAFEKVWRRLGLSLDWGLQYATIDDHCRKISQYSFLDLVNKGVAKTVEAPTMWDVDFRTAVAQAEIEDRETSGAFYDIRFGLEGDQSIEFTISTTRPELLAACIAVVAHPSDERYKHLFGRNAITPLFGAAVPICASEHADPEKGTGILMVCTFGDIHDVQWWKSSGLPIRQMVGLDGRILPVKFGEGNFASIDADRANQFFSQLIGLNIKQTHKKMAELLAGDNSGPYAIGKALVGEPKQITHAVKYYEKGDRPLEFVSSRQWFIDLLEHKEALIEQGRKVKWHPSHMLSRYENWVEGLNQNWCISRQRFFGVPFPVWYPVLQSGELDYNNPIYADPKTLPIDPLLDVPPGYKSEQRDQPGGFTGDPDVMDTWATSSLTPQIQSHWSIDQKRHQKLFPMDLRPQGHDIIRTWAFYTIAKAYLHDGEIPWKHIALSGWILDPDRKKMSKSKGNVVTPESILVEHSSDAIRYWASRARLGIDTAFDSSLFKIGAKLVTKLFNASKFVLQQVGRVNLDPKGYDTRHITAPLDCALVAKLRVVIEDSTKSFNDFEFAQALQTTEEAFWNFCDHYLELVKVRSYSEQDTPERLSAVTTLAWSLNTFLRLFAPFIPYITEEIWSWSFSHSKDKDDSIHRAKWPSLNETSSVQPPEHNFTFDAAVEIISKIRGAKTDSQKSLKWPVEKLTISGEQQSINALNTCLDDVLRAGNVKDRNIQVINKTATDGMFDVQVVLSQSSE